MAYAVDSLEPGDVLLVSGGATTLPGRALDALIRWSTGSRYTHASLYIGDGSIIEAVETVRLSPASKYDHIGYAFRPSATDAQKSAAIAAARKRLGRRYGTRELLYDALRLDMKIVVPPPLHPLWRLTCSGLVNVVYQAAGFPLSFAPWPSPGDLAASPVLLGTGPRF